MSIHDLFEIMRPTKSAKKNNKQIKRNYGFEDGESTPKTKKQYRQEKKEEEKDR